jgi:uncharacterized protein YwgA
MDEKYAGLLQLLSTVANPSVKKFEDRIRLQKLTYLAREIGFDTGFSFSWYLHGPYSPSLTNFLFSAEDLGVLGKPPKLSAEDERAMTTTVKKLKELLGDKVSDPRTLELVASVWYVVPRGTVTEKRQRELVKMLGQMKPDFTEEEYRRTVERVLKFRESELQR